MPLSLDEMLEARAGARSSPWRACAAERATRADYAVGLEGGIDLRRTAPREPRAS